MKKNIHIDIGTPAEAAEQYLKQGLSVIPARGDKRALIKWEPYQKSRMTEDEARGKFILPGAKGIAVICGKVSENLEVIDIDCKNDPSGRLEKEFFALLNEVCPELVFNLVTVSTINKGYHLYYRCDQVESSRVLSKNSKKEVLIETRGEGAYVIAPPSPGYRFVQGDFENIPLITPEERLTLLSIARSLDEPHPAEIQTPEPVNGEEGYSPFEDYNKRADVVALLEKHSWKVVKQKDECIYLQRPGKTENSVSASFQTRMKLFYPFTTSTVFEAGRAYNPVQVYTLLEAGNDLSAASKQLYREGYGERHNKRIIQTSESEKCLEFPVEGFPSFIQHFIHTCSSIYRTPKDYWAGAVLTATALGIGNKLELETRYHNLPVFWLVLIGDVSSGKSHPLEFCLEYFQKADSLSIRKYMEEKEEFERISALTAKERMKEGINGAIRKPACFQLILKDYTPEAMSAAQAVNTRGMLIWRDELKGMIDDFNRYNKSGEQSNMISSWSGESMTFNRKTSGVIHISKPCLSICGGIQPDLLPALAADSRDENGFLSRICAVYPDKTDKAEYCDEYVPDELIEKWEEYLSVLTGLEAKTIVHFGAESRKIYEAWYNANAGKVNEEKSGYLKGVYGKLDIIALRLALVIRGMNLACEGIYSEVITAEEMEAAIALTEYFRATALKVYRRIFAQNYEMNTKAVIAYLAKKGNSQNRIAEVVRVKQPYVCKVMKEVIGNE